MVQSCGSISPPAADTGAASARYDSVRDVTGRKRGRTLPLTYAVDGRCHIECHMVSHANKTIGSIFPNAKINR